MPFNCGFFTQPFGKRKGVGMGWKHGARGEERGAKNNG